MNCNLLSKTRLPLTYQDTIGFGSALALHIAMKSSPSLPTWFSGVPQNVIETIRKQTQTDVVVWNYNSNELIFQIKCLTHKLNKVRIPLKFIMLRKLMPYNLSLCYKTLRYFFKFNKICSLALVTLSFFILSPIPWSRKITLKRNGTKLRKYLMSFVWRNKKRSLTHYNICVSIFMNTHLLIMSKLLTHYE